MRLYKCFRVILFSFFLLSSFIITRDANSQETTGDLRLNVRDSLGMPIPSVNVSVTGPELQGVRGTVTDGAGRCVLLALSPGLVTVRLSHQAYQTTVCENVRIQLGQSTGIGTIILKESVHNLPELVISVDRSTTGANSTTYGSNLRTADVERLPLNRDYRTLVQMLPLSNNSAYGEGTNIGGATGYENKFVIDGVDVTDPMYQWSGTMLPYNFIREVQVKAGGYEADVSSALGGILNVITQSGSNEFHGSVFGFYTSDRFERSARIGLSRVVRGGNSDFDYGASFGGPIIRDQLWFFAAYNPTYSRKDKDVPGYGTFVNQSIVHSFAGKLTWRASDRLNLVMTLTGDPGTNDAVGFGVSMPPAGLTNPDSYFMDITAGGINLSLSGLFTIFESILLEGFLARVSSDTKGYPSTERGRNEPFYVDNLTDIWSGGPRMFWDSHRHATMGRIHASVTWGEQMLKAGIEYKVNDCDEIWGRREIDRYRNYYDEDLVWGHQTVNDRLPSVFLQDIWQISPHLRVNGGIRWDGQYSYGSNGSLAQTISFPLQPRFGFVYTLDEEASRSIFGAVGRFAHPLNLNCSANLFSDQGYSYYIRYPQDPRVTRAGADTLWGGPFTIMPEITGLRAQYFDDFSLGYEQAMGKGFIIRVQGVFRTLREAIDDAFIPSEGTFKYGNPGKGELAAWPRPQRDYTALILSVERSNDTHFNFFASYTLSRNYGNYGGLYDHVLTGYPNITLAFDLPSDTWKYGTGLLPNDRPHVFKLAVSYSFDFGLAAGILLTAQSGTPIDEFAWNDTTWVLTAPRGTPGRTPGTWNLSARFSYELPFGIFPRTRLMLDAFNIASQEKATNVQQIRGHIDATGQYDDIDPTYKQPYTYQRPMSVRLGIEVRL